jgi:hypothetical protein
VVEVGHPAAAAAHPQLALCMSKAVVP